MNRSLHRRMVDENVFSKEQARSFRSKILRPAAYPFFSPRREFSLVQASYFPVLPVPWTGNFGASYSRPI